MSHWQERLSFSIGTVTGQSTMWELWRNARTVLFTPWRATLEMPANRISILLVVVQSMAMVYLPIKKRQKKNQRFIPLALLPYMARLQLLR